MSDTIKTSLRGLVGHLNRDSKRIEAAIETSLNVTARRAVPIIRKRVPVAFGELRDSVHAIPGTSSDDTRTRVDAPHAAAVEQGSLPHTPDFEALVRWVKLRGMQGLTVGGNVRKRQHARALGPTTSHQARVIATELRRSRGDDGATPIDAPEQIARRISKGIEINGTKPHWFVQESLPEIRNILDQEIKKRIYAKERAEGKKVQDFVDAAERLGIADRGDALSHAMSNKK